mmetsp:Transcript_217/g.319  ORF Transcript_217/g.319 Transcript_217/m.319 type:complete len:113 (-) Transcript_217:281-619(-)
MMTTPWPHTKKILKGKVRFPRDFHKDAKSLVKHLLVADVTKRYGCLRNGANDIKNHRWFKNLDWFKLGQKRLPVPFIPQIGRPGDTSNFTDYPDSDVAPAEVSRREDPFIDW